MTDLTGAVWRKSTRSGDNGGNCVEVATNLPGLVAVRDSKDPTGPALTFSPAAWADFVRAARSPSQTG
ncbi:DUF397 domain-containing protein [Verrucosispora sp. WMMD1129]|uniref:DUF397 domain-containing protein n=1 Tax=Verrucosispora sp. WMMD1129 TaxID=3016093 RepID=UPI002499D898|nr:DUF397 domain-containing protein [Verrucosispora sp. WMMD1129]WFE48372.1 DUF397 domain-containing protein [Verrucosispora sp. WMMD1129]